MIQRTHGWVAATEDPARGPRHGAWRSRRRAVLRRVAALRVGVLTAVLLAAGPLTAGLGGLADLGPLGPGTAWGQQPAPQYVESLELYQRRIEGLVSERLSAILPQGDYVVRASVTGGPERVPRSQAGSAVLDLPGFRPSTGESGGGVEKVRVGQILVHVVVNRQVPTTDLQYIRTIVPILADFRPERGDRLDVQVIASPESVAEAVAAAPSVLDKPGPLGVTWMEWILLAVGALVLLVLLRAILRLAAPRKVVEPVAPPPAPPVVQEQPAMSAAEQRKMNQERQLAELRHGVVKRLFARPDLARELAVNWAGNTKKLADLAHGLGRPIARQSLLPAVGAEAYQPLEEQAFGIKPPDLSRLLSALGEANLFLLTQEITNPQVIRPNPFRFLDALSWGQISHLIKDEPVNVKAIVLSRMKPDDMARILEALPKDMQLEIAVSVGNLHDLPLEMAQSVATDLAEKSRDVPDARLVDIEGPATLVDLMSRTSSDTSRYLLEAMKSKDAKLSREVEKRFFLFEAIPLVPEEIVPQAVRTLPSSVVIQALQGASPDLQRKVVMGFPEQSRTGLVTALRASRADPETVQEARRLVVAKFQELGRQGRINLKQISDAWQAQSKAS